VRRVSGDLGSVNIPIASRLLLFARTFMLMFLEDSMSVSLLMKHYGMLEELPTYN
jgi:hypothetical protein